jgi:CBS domain-containing protein
MLDEPLRKVLNPEKLLTAAPETAVHVAAKRMAESKAGAIVVVEGERPVGIFTERDAVFRVMAEERDPATTLLSEVMTPQPKCLAPDDSLGYAMVMMHEGGFRHIPVVEDSRVIGIISARKALDPDLEEFESEAERRRRFRSKA